MKSKKWVKFITKTFASSNMFTKLLFTSVAKIEEVGTLLHTKISIMALYSYSLSVGAHHLPSSP